MNSKHRASSSQIIKKVHNYLSDNNGFYWTEFMSDPELQDKKGSLFYGKELIYNFNRGWIAWSAGAFLNIDTETGIPCLSIKANKDELDALLKKIRLNTEGLRSFISQNKDVSMVYGLTRTENDCPKLLRFFETFRNINWSDKKGIKIYFLDTPTDQTMMMIHGVLTILGCQGKAYTDSLERKTPYSVVLDDFFCDFSERVGLNSMSAYKEVEPTTP